MKFAFYTLGCKTNQYESQAMAQILTRWGHTVGDFQGPCDGYIINTCSVTAVADKKNRAVVRRCRREHPDAVIGVCGCYAQHAPADLRALGVTVIGGSGQRELFLRQLIASAEDHQRRETLDQPLKRREFEVLPPGSLESRTRAMLKIQDGCTNFCTYCIIPYTRGPVRSAPSSLVVEQARALAERGYREIVLTGIEIAAWGADLPGKPSLSALLETVCSAVPSLRIRLGSLEPRIVTEEFCRTVRRLPNLCPHFHLSMQSGCDSVLARMHRRYTSEQYLQSVTRLRSAFPGCAITTDMIVGFPGETEAEAAESLAFIRKCAFAGMHIFPYSRRPGTVADRMEGQLDNDTKEARSRAAIEVAQQMNRAYRQSLVGTVLDVLFEQQAGIFSVGHAPNYVKVYLRQPVARNTVASVAVEALCGDGVTGRLLA